MVPSAGITFAIFTATLWGIMPLALKLLLVVVDPYTLTMIRFFMAALILGAASKAWRCGPEYVALIRRQPGLYLLALSGMLCNFIVYLLALAYLTPTQAQILIQLGPLFLIIGGALLLKEVLGVVQIVGVCLTIMGMVLFFNRIWLDSQADPVHLGAGHILAVISAAGWAIYGLSQRRLYQNGATQRSQILFYAAASIIIMPLAQPDTLLALDGWAIGLILFASLNTLLAYGSLSEALRRMDAARVGAVLATMPIVTALSERGYDWLVPGALSLKPFNVIELTGMVIVVIGCAACALGGARDVAHRENEP